MGILMGQLKINENEAKELIEYMKNPPKRGRPKKVIVPAPEVKGKSLIFILRWPMLACAFIAFVLSCVITVTELGKRQPWIIAIPLGIALIGFSVCASEMGFYYSKIKKHGLAFIFLAIWILTVAYSINNTTSSFYDRWRQRTAEENVTTAQTLTNQALYDNLKIQITDIDAQIVDTRIRLVPFQNIIKKYDDPSVKKGAEYSNAYWGADSLEKKLKGLVEKKQGIVDKQNSLLEQHSDIKNDTGKTMKSTYYAFIAGIFKGVNADFLQFTIDLIPALVLDVIASMALYVFLFVKEEKT